jgi:hypothetical protein
MKISDFTVLARGFKKGAGAFSLAMAMTISSVSLSNVSISF